MLRPAVEQQVDNSVENFKGNLNLDENPSRSVVASGIDATLFNIQAQGTEAKARFEKGVFEAATCFIGTHRSSLEKLVGGNINPSNVVQALLRYRLADKKAVSCAEKMFQGNTECLPPSKQNPSYSLRDLFRLLQPMKTVVVAIIEGPPNPWKRD